MNPRLPTLAAALAAALPLLVAPAAQAQSRQDDLQKRVAAALSAAMPGGPGEIVGKLANLRPDGAISRNFNLGTVSQAVFRRTTPNVAPDCRQTQTPQKEPDEGLCTLDAGARDDPTGAYVMLAYSKNIGLGNVRYYRRPAFKAGDETEPPAQLKISDDDAFKQALAFAELVGVPKSEIPEFPAGAKLPVRTLGAGTEASPGKEARRYELQKVVVLPRALVVPGGLGRDPATGRQLNHVLVPGQAMVAVNDTGVQFARVDGWSDAQMDPKLDPKLVKSASALVNEITEDLYNEGVRRVGTLSILISLRKAYPNPDDPNPPICPVCGVLRPAVKVIVSQPAVERFTGSEKLVAAPGLVREYDLVAQGEAERPAR